MKLLIIFLSSFFVFSTIDTYGQTLEDAKKWYLEKKFDLAKPIFEEEYKLKSDNAPLNQWLGVIALHEGDLHKAKTYLEFASKKSIPEAYLYLGELYTKMYLFDDAEKEFAKYEKANKRKKEALEVLSQKRDEADFLFRYVRRTEEVQIIDSVVVNKADFLDAYKLSSSQGSLQAVSDFFNNLPDNNKVLFMNQRKDKIFYSLNDSQGRSKLYSMEKLLDSFGNEKKLPAPINQEGSQAYPFVMTDGLTIYFASTGHGSLGGYDLFVTRYNLTNDTYLAPNQLNMPFNSPFNDYMMAIDEEKGIGWFASDRFQPEDKVCIYTFIPSEKVILIDENEDTGFLARRARINSIKETWKEGANYSALLMETNKVSSAKKDAGQDFTFVIDDRTIYHTLSDFSHAGARSLFSQALDLTEKLEKWEKDLFERREQYAANINRQALTPQIIELEKRIENTKKEVASLQVRARNEEIRNKK